MTPPHPAGRPPTLARHYFRYLNATIISIVISFISYPITMRLLDERDLGLLGYFQVISLLWVGLAKMGAQHAILRFYPAWCLGERSDQERFYATLFFRPVVISFALTALVLAGLTGAHRFRPIPHVSLIYVVVVLGQAQALFSYFLNIAQAREESALVATLTVVQRFTRFVCVVMILLFINRSAMGVFQASLISFSFVLVYLAWWARRKLPWKRDAYDRRLFREGIGYGLPMAVNEITFILLGQVDRIMLRHLLGSFRAVGVYYVGTSLAINIGMIFGRTMVNSYTPVANRLYETEGAGAVAEMMRNVFRLDFYVLVSVSIGLYWVGADMLVLLAGPEKAESGIIFQWIGFHYTIMPLCEFGMIGLKLTRRSKTILATAMMGFLINLGLNWVMIPRIGVMGAVYATLIANLLLWLTQLRLIPHVLKPKLSVRDIRWPLLLGCVFFGICQLSGLFGVQAPATRLAVCGAIFVVSFVVPAPVLDPYLRGLIHRKVLDRLKR